jgi:hypothetical protein
MKKSLLTVLGCLLAGAALQAQYNNVELVPNQDNTLYEDVTGSISNGSGEYLFSGRTTTGENRRAVLNFDMSNIPWNATITHVTLTLHCSQHPTVPSPEIFNLHRVTGMWGEGSSDAPGSEGTGTAASMGDATWTCAFHDGMTGCLLPWGSPGGDFNPAVSASQTVDLSGTYYTWNSTSQLVADVQDMLNNPSTNFGWILIGNEAVNQTARRFDSEENANSDFRPVLTVYFTMNAGGCSITDQTVSANPSAILCEGTGMLQMTASESGVRYWMYDTDTYNIIGNEQWGNGSQLNFATPVLSSDATYGIYAEKTLLSPGLDFNGFNTYVDVPGLTLASNFTLESWVYVRSYAAGSYNTFFECTNDAPWFGLNDGALSLYIDGTEVALDPSPFPLNQWVHVAAVFTPGLQTIYINGSPVATGNAASHASQPNLGIAGNGSDFPIDGVMDEVRIWSIARTQQELTDFMPWCIGSTSGLMAYYQFNQGTGTMANDNSGNGYNGTLVNMDPVASWVSGVTNCGPSCSMFSSNTATFQVVPLTDLDLTPSVNTLCDPGTATISTVNSDLGITYVLRDDATNTVIDGPLTGTGSNLTFNTGTLSSNTSFNVFAQNIAPSLGIELLGTSSSAIFPQGNTVMYQDFTAESWFKQTLPASYTSDAPVLLVFNEVAGNPNDAACVYINDVTGNPYIFITSFITGPVAVSAPGAQNLLDGQWHHVSLVGNSMSATYELYIDGVLSTSVITPVNAWTGSIVSGFDVLTFAPVTRGSYDDIRFWSVARNAGQIAGDMNTCLAGTESDLTGYWRVDEGAGRMLNNRVAGSPLGDIGLDGSANQGVDYNWTTGNTSCIVCEQEMTEIVTITVGDTEAPVVACQDVTVVLDAAGTATISELDIDNGSVDNCDIAPVYSLDITSFDCNNLPTPPAVKMVIVGVMDGPLTGGLPKYIELYTLAPIADLSEYGVSSATNGAGPTGAPEFTFPAVSAPANTSIFVASESVGFTTYMGFAPDYTDGAANVNGDDAFELFYNGSVVDVFGEVSVDGTGQPWEYLDGWAYRDVNTGPDGSTFVVSNWSYSGPNALDPCASLTNGTCSSVYPGGSYSWTPSGGTVVTMTVTDADANAASCTSTVTVVDNDAPVISGMPANIVITSNNAGCTGIASWTAPTITDNCTFAFTSTHNSGDAFPIGVTTVSYTAEDGSGNMATASFTVTVSSDLASVAGATDLLCFGDNSGAIDLTVTGGTAPYSFNWSNGATSEDLSNIAGGTYTVVVTDAIGCTFNDGATVNEPSSILINASTSNPTGCGVSDGSVDITVTGGTVAGAYSYSWNTGATTEDLSAIPAGYYEIIVTDDNGCTATASGPLEDPNAPTLTVNSFMNTNCYGSLDGEIDMNVVLNGGATSATYTWSNGASTEDITGLVAGFYSVVVVDNNGCTTGLGQDITEPDQIVITGAATATTCNGDTDGSVDITVTGGTIAGSYTFDWNSGAFNTEDIAAVGANTYNVVVSDDNGCTANAMYTVNEPDAVTGSGVATDASCNGSADGDIDFSATGGNGVFTYLWNDAGASVTEDITGLTANTYDVVITDGNGCSGNASVVVGEPAVLAASGVSTDIMMGNDGTIDLTVTGGTATYTYAWTGPAGFTATTEDLSALNASGTYDVTVTDANGCTATAAVILNSQLGVNTMAQIQLSVFPNPTTGMFRLETGMSAATIVVRDALGREVVRTRATGNSTALNMATFEDGIYFVEVSDKNATRTVRIVLSK